MDLDALIAAAKEIDRKSVLLEAKTRRFAELASMARKVADGSPEHNRIKAESRQNSMTVIDFGDCINDLRRALKARPKKKPTPPPGC